MNKAIFLIIILFSKTIFAEDTKIQRVMIDSHWSGSLMFVLKDLEKIRKSLDIYHEKFAVKDNNLTRDKEIEENLGDHEKPKFLSIFLSSLIYNSETDWAVWLNEKKITSREKLKFNKLLDLEIKEISKYSITLEIFFEDLDLLSPNWKEYLKIVDGELYRSKKYPINYWRNQKKIEVKLYPNQNFIIREMAVIEGEENSN